MLRSFYEFIPLFFLFVSCFKEGEKVRIEYTGRKPLISFIREIKDSGVVYNEYLLRILLKVSGTDRYIKPGVYIFRKGEGSIRAYMTLKNGPAISHFRFTIREGESLKDFLKRLSDYGYDSNLLLSLAKDTAFINSLSKSFDFLRGKRSLEGFLYPETYFINYGADEKDIFIPPLKRFKKVWDSLKVEERSKDVGLDPYSVLILASIVEKEAVLDEEKPIIASVFLNRLKRGMPLAADPTIKYVLVSPPKLLSRKQTEIPSPYNTYKFKGLPPTPICSPTAGSIEAVLSPAKTRYLYFVSANGRRHRFATTYREHLRNVRKMKLE